jgi:hypothetical protein
MMIIIRAFIFFSIISAFSASWAKDLYVSTTGSDSNSYAINDIDHPWATPIRAWGGPDTTSAECAKAGDTVYFRAGMYVISSTINTKYFGNNGTEKSPIIFKNYPKEKVVFNGGNLNIVFEIQKNWNIIDGITTVGGITFFRFGYDIILNGGIVQNCNSTRNIGGDNAAFVYVNSGNSGISIINCRIIGPGLISTGIHQNTAGIIAFNAPGLKVKNCEIYNVPIGIYYKHGQKLISDSGIELSYNFIHDTDRYCIELNANFSYVHDNIFEGPNGYFRVNEANGGAGGDYNLIDHNTFIDTGFELSADLGGALYNKITNNVFKGPLSLHAYSTLAHNSEMDFNLFFPNNSIIEFSNTDIYTPENWKLRKIYDLHSYIGNPAFTSTNKKLGTYRFKLASGIGKNGGSDLKDVGADAEKVGIITLKKM